MSLGRSFGLITQRSQVQILTPLPTARPARVFPWPAFFVSPSFFPSYITSPTGSARNVFARTKRLSVGLRTPQAAPALLERVACCPPVSTARGQRRGLHPFAPLVWTPRVAASRKPHRENHVDCKTVIRVQIPAGARIVFPQNEKGPRANGIPFLTSTLPVTKGLL